MSRHELIWTRLIRIQANWLHFPLIWRDNDENKKEQVVEKWEKKLFRVILNAKDNDTDQTSLEHTITNLVIQ